MIPKSRSLVLDRLNAENIEKVHDRHLFDFIDVHRLTVLVDDELHANTKLRVEMSRAVAPNKPFLNGSGQSYCIRQVYFRFQCHGTTIDKRSLVLQGKVLDSETLAADVLHLAFVKSQNALLLLTCQLVG